MERSLIKSKFMRAASIALVLWTVFTGSAKSGDLDGKFTTILTYEADNTILKLRPFDYTFASKTQRVDLLIGRRFRGSSADFTAYAYWKWDNKDRSWIGTLLDFGIKALEGRLSTNLELRFFRGLNERSKEHLYAIPTIYYKIGDKGIVRAGISGYGKMTKGEDPFFYVGLDAIIKITDHISTLLSYSKDTFGSGDFIWWIIYYYF